MKKIFTLSFILSVFLLLSSNVYSKANKNLACPTASINYAGTPFCTSINNPQTVTLTGTDAFTGGFFTSTAGLFIDSLTGAITPNLSMPGTYIVTYTIAPDGTCSGAITTTMITILPSQSITLTSSSANRTVCPNEVIMNINFAITNGTGAAVTGLPPGVTGAYAAGTFTIFGTPTASGVYTYTITTTGSCPPVATATGTITVSDSPIASVNSSTICPGSTATVTAIPSSSGTYTYSWTVPPGVTNPGNVASFSTTVGGTYSVVLTNTSTSCSGSSASGTVTVMPNSENFSLFCNTINASQVNFDWNNITGITTFYYSYSINGGPIMNGSQAAPSSLTITNNGQPVTFTISGSGSVCVAPVTITCGNLGIHENLKNGISISPNPVIDILNIKNHQIINKVTAHNQLGQKVLQKEFNSSEIQLNFSDLKPGIYFISIDSENKQSSYKIIKQ
ncbi:T9SS type A sorting domain-containing protein [Flavobacterium enshiense]|uniref:T9SS type A sorting domain-containing protein n=1 Tax=Flavobacterium enshiense TaxID=1341165 RepID=UPI00345C9A02